VEAVVFFFAAIGALGGAIGVIALRNPFYSVLALIAHLFSLAALFLLLTAAFVAAAQVVVYAGAVMVLYVFVVAYVGGQDERRLGGSAGRGSTALAVLFAGALLVELCIAVLGSGLQALDTEGAGFDAGDPNGFGSPGYIGRLLLTKFLFPFEAASILLLVAAVGAVVLARRRGAGSTIDDQTITFAQVLQPPGTGSMAEAVSGRVGTPALEAETSEGMGDAAPERDKVEAGW
jgi:NADH-quinone oxidoreductase subunit J